MKINDQVVGIHDLTLSKRLQTDETLTLDKAKKLIRQRDAVREQQQILRKGEDSSLEYTGNGLQVITWGNGLQVGQSTEVCYLNVHDVVRVTPRISAQPRTLSVINATTVAILASSVSLRQWQQSQRRHLWMTQLRHLIPHLNFWMQFPTSPQQPPLGTFVSQKNWFSKLIQGQKS